MTCEQAHPDTPLHSPGGHCKKRTPPDLPPSIISKARETVKEAFDAHKHVQFEPPKKILTMQELGFEDRGISQNAVSDPFPLFSNSAIEQMRAEIFSQPVLDKYHVSSVFASNQIRGAGPRLTPFIHNAWNSPQVLAAVSQVAGVDLIPVFEYDTGHCNVSVRPDGDTSSPPPSSPPPRGTEAEKDEKEVFGWHEDCFPFVCVVMLSDCSEMVGGETMLKTGNGELLKVRGPSKGTAVVMQGRYIPHAALAAHGGRERIAMVTSFRPRDPHAKDDSFLGGVRRISHVPTVYQQYAEYRLENLEERLRRELKKVRMEGKAVGAVEFDYKRTRAWLEEQRDFIGVMIEELKDEKCC